MTARKSSRGHSRTFGNEYKAAVYRDRAEAFDHGAYQRLVDAVIRVFHDEYFQRAGTLGHSSDVPVFVVGMVRSGTSLVEQILASHPDVRGAGERRDLEQISRALPGTLGSAEPFPDCLTHVPGPVLQCLAENYLQRLEDVAGVGRRIVDKMPHNFLFLGLAGILFPRARVIHCVRDARDLAASIYFQNFKWLPYATSFEDIAFVYRQYSRLMKHWRQALNLPVQEVSYEALVANFGPAARSLIDFCGLPWDDRCLAFHQNRRSVQTASRLQVRRPIYSSSVGRWKPYESQLRPLLEAMTCAEADIRRHG